MSNMHHTLQEATAGSWATDIQAHATRRQQGVSAEQQAPGHHHQRSSEQAVNNVSACPAGSKGNKTEQSAPLLFSVLLSLPMVAFFVYYLQFQTYV